MSEAHSLARGDGRCQDDTRHVQLKTHGLLRGAPGVLSPDGHPGRKAGAQGKNPHQPNDENQTEDERESRTPPA